MTHRNYNEEVRQTWLAQHLAQIPAGSRILDAGAGELKNKTYCTHLEYVSQDFCQYQGAGDGTGLHSGTWDVSSIDLVCDICEIPEPDSSFDAILCSEVLEHIPEPCRAIDEFNRLLRPDGVLVLTAPFASMVHLAPYHFCSGFSKYWYEHHLPLRGFEIDQLSPNGDWFSYCYQELTRLGSMARRYGDPLWPLAYFSSHVARCYFTIRQVRKADDVACFGWHCVARKKVMASEELLDDAAVPSP